MAFLVADSNGSINLDPMESRNRWVIGQINGAVNPAKTSVNTYTNTEVSKMRTDLRNEISSFKNHQSRIDNAIHARLDALEQWKNSQSNLRDSGDLAKINNRTDHPGWDLWKWGNISLDKCHAGCNTNAGCAGFVAVDVGGNKFDCYFKGHLSKQNTITRDKHDLYVKAYDSFMKAPNLHDPRR